MSESLVGTLYGLGTLLLMFSGMPIAFALIACGIAPGYPQAFERAADRGSSVSYGPDPANQPIYERQCRRARALYKALATSEFREQMQ